MTNDEEKKLIEDIAEMKKEVSWMRKRWELSEKVGLICSIIALVTIFLIFGMYLGSGI